MADLFSLPILDPRNEEQLTQEAKIYAFQVSGGAINSTNDGDPIDVLVRTQAYTGAELLFYVSQLPLSLAVKVLALTGAKQSPGTKARATVRFTLVAPRGTNFFIPAGFEVQGTSRKGTFSFFTVDSLTIIAGQQFGDAIVEAEFIGEDYNLSAGRINQITQPIAFLGSVSSLEASSGGFSGESTESAIARALAALRRRSPISESDFEEYAQELMGVGSRAKAIGLLGINKTSFEKGAVHLFLLSGDGNPANTALQTLVRNGITPKIQLGTKLHVSAMGILPITAEVLTAIEDGSDPEVVADGLWSTFLEYLNPLTFEPGASADPDEAGHQMRFSGGIEYIDEVYFNQQTIPVAMPNQYTIATPYSLVCRLTTSSGTAYTVLRGVGEPPGGA